MFRFLVVFLLLLVVVATTSAQDVDAPPEFMFDDFDYTAYDDPAFGENGWVVRQGEGWPGVPGAIWRAENVTFVADPEETGNSLLQMTSSTNYTDTYQTQVCHQRKYREGTFATRVRFSDAPASGRDGDNIVQTFYLISPQAFPMDPDYSELDFEYLPNGGWGARENIFHFTTWETFQLEPWIADNISDHVEDSFEGWHTLVLQIMDGEVRYFVDGVQTAVHGGEFYPEVLMSLNYNLWFINGGLVYARRERAYVEQIDWVYAAANTRLSPEDVEQQVAALRNNSVSFADSVIPPDPLLETPCNF